MCLECTKQVLQKAQKIKDSRGKQFLKRVMRMQKLMEKYFKLMESRGMQELANRFHIAKVEYSDEEYQQWLDDFETEHMKTYVLGQKALDKELQSQISLGLALEITDDRAKQYAQEATGLFIKGVDEDTRKVITNIIVDNINEGLAQKDIASKIIVQTAQYAEWRAMLIANMETMNAFSLGEKYQFDQYRDSFGAPGRKSSQAQDDSRTRPEHQANEDAGRIPYSEPFPFGNLNNMFAPYDYACRCRTKRSLFNPVTGNIW